MTESAPVVKTDPDPTLAVEKALTLAIKNLDDKVGLRFDMNDRAVSLAREEVKTATAELAKAYADALAAALRTTTEAQGKMADSFKSESASTNEKIDRVIERINLWTGRDNTLIEGKQDRSNTTGHTIAIISAMVALTAVIITVFTLVSHR